MVSGDVRMCKGASWGVLTGFWSFRGCTKQAASVEPVPQATNRVKDAARRCAVAFGDP